MPIVSVWKSWKNNRQDTTNARIWLTSCPKDRWTLKTGYFEDLIPAIQVQTLPLEGPRSLGWWFHPPWKIIGNLPQVEVKNIYIYIYWNHHLVKMLGKWWWTWWFTMIERNKMPSTNPRLGGNMLDKRAVYMSHEKKKPPTFQYTGWLMRNPYIGLWWSLYSCVV